MSSIAALDASLPVPPNGLVPVENTSRRCSSNTVRLGKQENIFLVGRCLIQVIDQAIQLNHRKILDVDTILVAVWKMGITRSNKPFPGCLVPPGGVGTGTGNGADVPATKLATD